MNVVNWISNYIVYNRYCCRRHRRYYSGCDIHTHAHTQKSLHNIFWENKWVHNEVCKTFWGRGMGMNITARYYYNCSSSLLLQIVVSIMFNCEYCDYITIIIIMFPFLRRGCLIPVCWHCSEANHTTRFLTNHGFSDTGCQRKRCRQTSCRHPWFSDKLLLFVWLGGVFLVWVECPAWCPGGRRPLIAGCFSLQRHIMDLP